MPCRDYEYDKEPKVTQTEFDKLLAKHNDMTALLCTATKLLHRYNIINYAECPQSLRDWHFEHEKADREEAIKVALNKLTPAERALLGHK